MRVNMPRSIPLDELQDYSSASWSARHKASMGFCLAAFFFLGVSLGNSLYASTADTAHDPIAAARMNNTGVALMNQQLLEKALAKFEEAHKIDPTSAVPILNQGIALLYLRKLPEAEAALKQAAAIDPNNVRTWYSLGLTHFTGDNPTLAIDDFNRAIKIGPDDADTYYYLGSL